MVFSSVAATIKGKSPESPVSNDHLPAPPSPGAPPDPDRVDDIASDPGGG